MRRPTNSRGIEAALQRVVERPFLRRTPVSLPLLRSALRRAMEDELKLMVPSRYTITIPAEQIERLGEQRDEWEQDLAAYFQEVLRNSGWSAVGEPRLTIAYDPSLTGTQVQVAVEEPGLLHNGGTFHRQKHRTLVIAAFMVILMICLALLTAVTRPDVPGALPGNLTVAPRQQYLPAAGAHLLSGPDETRSTILAVLQ